MLIVLLDLGSRTQGHEPFWSPSARTLQPWVSLCSRNEPERASENARFCLGCRGESGERVEGAETGRVLLVVEQLFGWGEMRGESECRGS